MDVHRSLGPLVLLGLVHAGCADSTSLLVDVHTDFVHAEEYSEVRVTVDGVEIDSLGATPLDPVVRRLGPYAIGRGAHVVEVELIDRGRRLVGRAQDLELRDTTVVAFWLLRICRNVTCPDGADREATECENGRCVHPACSIAHPEACDDAPACSGDGSCEPPTAPCATATCADGYCVVSEVRTGTFACRGEDYCDPDEGCRRRVVPVPDAGPMFDAGGAPSDAPPSDASGSDAPMGCGAGCNDGNPCTDDTCGGGSCVFTPNTVACDDGLFCNGFDTCGGGACSGHAGSPCGALTCDEGADVCRGCSVSGCPGPTYSEWGSCAYADPTCSTSGVRSRTVLSFACVSDTCQPSSTTENDGAGCARGTDGTMCGPPDRDEDLTMCTRSGTPCDGRWFQDVRHHRFRCGGGSCVDMYSDERGLLCHLESFEGDPCGEPSMSSTGCTYADTCDEAGSEMVTTTNYVCRSSTCRTEPSTASVGCSRSTAGVECIGVRDVATGPCEYATDCSEVANEPYRTEQVFCESGTCSDLRVLGSSVRTCDTRSTAGQYCGNDGCTNYSCQGGSCQPDGPPCP